MKAVSAVLLFSLSVGAAAQSADALYQQACGPKAAEFDVQLVKSQPPAAPEPGKALVYFIQRENYPLFITRVGLDGAWVGVLQHESWIPISISPGEHHACAASQDRKHPGPELLHFTAEAGKTYYLLVRGIAGNVGGLYSMEIGPADRDEALYLIAADPQSVAKPAVKEPIE